MARRKIRKNRTARTGVIGTVIMLAVVAAFLAGNNILAMFGGHSYRAAFSEAGGISPGDTVIVSGMPSGKVDSVTLMDTWVQVTFSISNGSVNVGDLSSAQIKSQTPLGKKALQITPAGSNSLAQDALIPLDRTTPPYDVTEALSNLTKNVTNINTPQLSSAVNILSQTFADTSAQVGPVLNGLQRISTTIGSRDQAIQNLLKSTSGISGVLASRDAQIQRLVGDGATLLSTLNGQRDSLNSLFENTTALSTELQGTITDNRDTLKPALDQLDGVLAILQRKRGAFSGSLTGGSAVLRNLGEAIASFPGFSIYIVNLIPTNLIPGLKQLLTGTN
jgi:phospholipid/cholesterol/gamma-HCH transport system substrate-binding protein